jgi:hypothetical protein
MQLCKREKVRGRKGGGERARKRGRGEERDRERENVCTNRKDM